MSDLLDNTIDEIIVYMDSIELIHIKKPLVALYCEHKDLWAINELNDARKAYLFDVAIHNQSHAKLSGWYAST